MDLQALLQWSRLQAIASALEDAGVETVQDLLQYYDDIRALAPDSFRQEMAETFGCKRIEISRLVAALDKHVSGDRVAEAQVPRQQELFVAFAREPQASGLVDAQDAQIGLRVDTTPLASPSGWTAPRAVSPLSQEAASEQPRQSHDLCAEFDEPMTAQAPWLAAAMGSAETDAPVEAPPPYDDAWRNDVPAEWTVIPAAESDELEPQQAVVEPDSNVAAAATAGFQVLESGEINSPPHLQDLNEEQEEIRADEQEQKTDAETIEPLQAADSVDAVTLRIVADEAEEEDEASSTPSAIEIEPVEPEAEAEAERDQSVESEQDDEHFLRDSEEEQILLEGSLQVRPVDERIPEHGYSVAAAAGAGAGAALALTFASVGSHAEQKSHDDDELFIADAEPSAPLLGTREEDLDMQAVSQEFDEPCDFTTLPEVEPSPEPEDVSVQDADDAWHFTVLPPVQSPVCTVTSAQFDRLENVVTVSVVISKSAAFSIHELVTNCTVVVDGRAINAFEHDLQRAEQREDASQEQRPEEEEEEENDEGDGEDLPVSGSLRFSLGLRPLPLGVQLPTLRFEYDNEELDMELRIATPGAHSTRAVGSEESQLSNLNGFIPAIVATEVVETHGMDSEAEIASATSVSGPQLVQNPTVGFAALGEAARRALFITDEFETTDGEDDRSSRSSNTRGGSATAFPLHPSISSSLDLDSPTATSSHETRGSSTFARFPAHEVSLSQLPAVEAIFVSGEGASLQEGIAVDAEVVTLDVVGQTDEHASELVVPPSPVPTSRRLDIATMNVIAREPKSGALKKYAKYMKGSWHDRYFVLDGRTLWYFKTKKDFNRNNEAKRRILELMPTSAAIRATAPLTFTVGGKSESWLLQAATEADMYEWINAINAHIHFLYVRVHGVRVGGLGEQLQFPQYFVLAPQPRKAMGIRSIPDVKGPRTGGLIQPGEIIEVVQLYPAGAQPQDDDVFFRLADDKGWLFQLTSESGKVFLPAAGFAFDEEGFYQIHLRCRTPVPLRFGPTFQSQLTGVTLEPGEKFRVCRRWVSGVNEGADFLKLTSSSSKEGWVQVFNKARESAGDSAPQQIVQELSEAEFLGHPQRAADEEPVLPTVAEPAQAQAV